jgi:hypothetical protein
MDLEKRELSGREKDESSIEHLEELREKLYFARNNSARRTAAFNLSWKQEDGFEILKEVLLSENSERQSKTAAAYGLRSMRGRMKKIARQVIYDGIDSESKEISEVCKHAVRVLENRKKASKPRRKPPKKHRKNIKEFKTVSHKSPRERKIGDTGNYSKSPRKNRNNFRRNK